MQRSAARLSNDREETVRAVLAAVESQDVDTMLSRLAPDVEWYPPEQGTLEHVYRGHDGVRRMFAQLFDSWARIVHEPMRFIEREDTLIVLARLRLEGRGSHLALADEWGYVVTFRDGLIHTVRMHTDPAVALAEIAVAER